MPLRHLVEQRWVNVAVRLDEDCFVRMYVASVVLSVIQDVFKLSRFAIVLQIARSRVCCHQDIYSVPLGCDESCRSDLGMDGL